MKKNKNIKEETTLTIEYINTKRKDCEQYATIALDSKEEILRIINDLIE